MSSCTEQTTAKYTRRNSPPYPANECCGQKLRGKDGQFYESREDKRSICRWYKVKQPSASAPGTPKAALAKKSKADSKKRLGCVEQTTAKYLRRKSPAFPANECCGEQKLGNDGLPYESRPNKNNVCRWYKIAVKSAAKKAQGGVRKRKAPKRSAVSARKPAAARSASAESGCVKKATAKYTKRKSPPYPANECCGQRKKGNDGTMYESRANKNGVCRWYKVKSMRAKSSAAAKKTHV